MQNHSSIFPAHFGLRPGAKPMRARPQRGYTPSWDGKFGASKALGPAPIESLLERDFQILLTANPWVKSYGVQCHRLVYWAPDAEGRFIRRTYTPDITAQGPDGQIAVMEVKAGDFVRTDKWQRVEPYIREAYHQDHGATFQVFTEAEVRAQPRLSNCEEMVRFRSSNDPEADAVIRRLVAGRRFTTLGDLLASALDRSIGDVRSYGAIMRSVMMGELNIDMSVPISEQTRAWAAQQQ